MSDSGTPNGLSTKREERPSTPDILMSGSDESFIQSLYDFIEHEKRFLQCPEDGPDDNRYMTYSSVFNKVIVRSTAYKRLLLTIKAEYDDTIRKLKRREEETRSTQQTVATLTLHPKSLLICQRRAAQLKNRIFALHREKEELKEELERNKSIKERSAWISGLTVAESEDVVALDRHLKLLEAQRDALLDRKSRCVSEEVKAELETKLQAAERHKEQLSSQNEQLRILYQRLKSVCDCLSSWEEAGQQVPLEDVLGSTLQNVGQTGVTESNERSIDAELFEDEEPRGMDESKHLTDYLHRFIELFESGQYHEAALLAARSPRGVLRNLDTMEMFKGVTAPSEAAPPPLFFAQALLMTASPGEALPAPLSLQVILCALQHNASQLITHAVTHNKLTFSEDLGDILAEHAQKNRSASDLCLALATTVYEACGRNRKTALSMCRRGLIHSAAEFMSYSKDLAAEDCLWILRRSPSLPLLQLLTKPQQGAASFPAGVACSALLADAEHTELALQLLDSFISEGVLEKVILEDRGSSVDIWTDVSFLCSGLSRSDLSQAILSVLLDQSGTSLLSPDLEGARLMEHVFL